MYTNSINTSNAISGTSSYKSALVGDASQALMPAFARPTGLENMPLSVSGQERSFYQNVITALINIVMTLVAICLPSSSNCQGETGQAAAGQSGVITAQPTPFSQLGDALDGIWAGVNGIVPWAKEAWSSVTSSCGGIAGLITSIF
jgi:hypothetical protein